ncbi:MAG: DEAD/DEAH box helicase, partial [Gemmatimonadetes bacterium]|nr:DEAD/DEAH box helicase [Gemmatimonadota bacterium]NIR80223.1 DEAD/DEAH box helicase [Gemmatimonadota bacterium]NIT86752.1 DEAD/DEAH box helicase [Gemmatimonadota bacterium]NIU30620.1 DEAD/DEAH box helicase [Gemmatimonadota bacterium]NIU35428.1 DEAD/DEAH box helicase [Gemmatimonadota bacterium]
MSTFEELGLGPEIAAALAASGFEVPTPLQEGAIPVLRRGNNLVARAGPGAGVLVAVAAPLLDRLEPDPGQLRLLVLTPTRDRAEALARSAASLGRPLGVSVAALGSTWAGADDAAALFATPSDALEAVRGSRVKLGALEALVVDGAAALAALDRLDAVDTLAGFLPREAQRVVVALPLEEEVEEFAERHARRAVHVPPRSAVEADDSHIPRRGRLRHHAVEGPRLDALLRVLGPLVAGEPQHVALFFHTDQEGAELGEALGLRGFSVGAPGDPEATV